MTVTAAPMTSRTTASEASARQRFLSYFLFALGSSFYLLPFMRVLLQGTDEGTLISGAERVLRGQVFARDFFEAIGPGTFYWLAMSFKIFGVTFIATRISLFFSSLGTGVLIYILSRRLCGRYSVLPAIVLAGTYFGVLWPAISHHVDSNFFALLSFTCIVFWQERQKIGLILAAGAMAGVTTCFLQPKGMLLLFSMLLWLWIERRQRAISWSAVFFLVGSYCSVLGIVLLWFWSRHALWDLIYANFVYPSQHYNAVNIVPYAQGMIRDFWDRWMSTQSGFTFRVAMSAVLITPLLFVAALPALLPALAALQRKSVLKPQILLYWLVGTALWLSEVHRKDIYHLVFGSPLLIILCIGLLVQARTKIADLSLQILAISSSCLACFNLFLVLAASPVSTRVGSVAMFQDDPVLRFIDKHVAPGEEMFAYTCCPMYYFLSSTRNPTRYSFLMYSYNTPSQYEDTIQVLDQRRVRYVIWNTDVEGLALKFPSMKWAAPDQRIIEPYLKSHYKVVWAENGFLIMERKSEGNAN